MSMYTTFKTWEEMVDYLKDVSTPQCFAVNYKPNENEYDLWIGSQPYKFYDERIDELEKEAREYKKLKSKYDLSQIEGIGEVVSNLSLLRHRASIPFGNVGIPTEYGVDRTIAKGFRFMKW